MLLELSGSFCRSSRKKQPLRSQQLQHIAFSPLTLGLLPTRTCPTPRLGEIELDSQHYSMFGRQKTKITMIEKLLDRKTTDKIQINGVNKLS